MKEKITKFGKTMPIVAIALLLFASIGVATLLEYYGQVTGDVTVERAINLYENGIPMSNAEASYSLAGIGGSSYTNELYTITNDAQVPITMDVVITYSPAKTWNNIGECDGITATVYEDLTKTLILDNKNPDWSLTPTDSIGATLTYNIIGDIFDYTVSATGLDGATNYSIIYYADKPDRFKNWGGGNPGALIGTFITDSSGIYVGSNNKNIDMNLPSELDTNIDTYSYCDNEFGDHYNTCNGAKIWIVPTSVLPCSYPIDDEWAFWGDTIKEKILYETDLIHYYDTDSGDLMGFDLDSNKAPLGKSITTLTIPAGDSANFVVLNEFALNAISDGCEITVSLDVPIL